MIQGLAVVELGGRGDTVGAVAEEDLVEIQLEYFVLAQRLFDASGQKQFGKLARVAFFGAEEEVAGNLLSDRARALGFLAAAEYDMQAGAHNALPVEAGVFVEARIFGGDEGPLQLGRYMIDRYRNAAGFTEGGDQLVVRGVDAQRDLKAHLLEGFHGGQARCDQPVGNTERDAADYDPEQCENQEITQKTQKQAH